MVRTRAVQLSEDERSQLRRFIKRPRSRKQLYRSQAVLALDDGTPAETVARQFHVGVDKVESWIARFQKQRLKFLAEPRERAAREEE